VYGQTQEKLTKSELYLVSNICPKRGLWDAAKLYHVFVEPKFMMGIAELRVANVLKKITLVSIHHYFCRGNSEKFKNIVIRG
jgi:hypothetical protein